MAPQLKVFRTPIGFHDAYVAVPSQKAALKAWGASADLFARGAAERVTDVALMEDALAHPGTVIRRRRASPDEHFASLTATKAEVVEREQPGKQKRPAAAKPPPSRAALDAAEQALTDHQQRAAHELAALKEEQARIAERMQRLRQQQEREAARLGRAVEKERRRHDTALERWRAS